MRMVGLTILLLSIASLTVSFSFFKPKSRDYADIAREIRANVGKKLSKKHQMDLIGVGGGMMGSVYMIGLHFQVHHPLDQNEARERLVDCVDELLTAVNSNEEIRPFLKNYPFTTKNVQVSIISVSPDGRTVFDPFITVVAIHESDYITFRTKEPQRLSYKNSYKELYSDALTMLRKGKNEPIYHASSFREGRIP